MSTTSPFRSIVRTWAPRAFAVAGATALAASIVGGGGAMADGAPPVRAPGAGFQPPMARRQAADRHARRRLFLGASGRLRTRARREERRRRLRRRAAATAHYEIVGTETTGHAETRPGASPGR